MGASGTGSSLAVRPPDPSTATHACLLVRRHRKSEARWENRHTVVSCGDAVGELSNHGLLLVAKIPAVAVTVLLSAMAIVLVTSPSSQVLLVVAPARLGAVLAAPVRLHPPADGFGRDTGADFNVRLLDNHARLNRLSSTASPLGCQHPLSVRLGQLINRNNTDAARVVATVSRTKTNTPSGLQQSPSLVVVSYALHLHPDLPCIDYSPWPPWQPLRLCV